MKTTLEPTPGSFDDALQKGEVWRQEQTVTVAMNTPQPTRDGDSYIWNVKMVLENGEFAVYKGESDGVSQGLPQNYWRCHHSWSL